jgi:hypothetical protein
MKFTEIIFKNFVHTSHKTQCTSTARPSERNVYKVRIYFTYILLCICTVICYDQNLFPTKQKKEDRGQYTCAADF